MRQSLHSLMIQGVQDYSEQKRIDWIKSHVGQVVLTANHIFWTQGVTKALAEGQHKLKEFYKESNDKLSEIVQLVRGKLDKKVRKILGALVIMDVHSRDVVKLLIDNKTTSAEDFDWTSQLRMYWEDNDVTTAIADATGVLGYEYIGELNLDFCLYFF